MEEGRLRAKGLAVRIDCSWKAGREPVERRGIENFVDWRRGFSPLLKFLADPEMWVLVE